MIRGLAGAAGILIWTTGIIFGVVATVLSAIRLWRTGVYPGHRRWEIAAVVVSIFCAYGAVVVLIGWVESGNYVLLALASAQLAAALAAIVVYFGPWRRMAEGLSSIAVGLLVVLTGFSIGFFVLPFSTLLGAAAIYHADPRTPKTWRRLRVD